jgi:hypothetical protein
MRFALRNQLSAIAFVAAAAMATSAQSAFADSAFVSQATKGAFFSRSLVSSPVTAQSPAFFAPPSRGGGVTQPTPETTVPASGGNFAGTLEMGRNNTVLQAQSGAGNSSNVGILGGVHDNVDVLQHGQGLVSNLALVGVKGLTVDVIQPPGTAPVNMLIGRLPNGTLGIFQPQGAPPATIFRVGNVLVVK